LEVPCLVAKVTPEDVLGSSSAWRELQTCLRNTSEARSQGRGSGLSAVVIFGSDDANKLYEAGIKAKEVMKSFPAVPLLLHGRPDIAAACGCEGVVLSATDIPTVAARKILGNDESGDEQASIVVREVSDAETARTSAEQGASALLVDCSPGNEVDLDAIKSSQRGAASIPVLVSMGAGSEADGPAALEDIDGFVGDMGALTDLGNHFRGKGPGSKFADIFSNALLSREERESSANEGSSPDSFLTSPAKESGPDASAPKELKKGIEGGLRDLQAVVNEKAPRLIDGQEGNASTLISDALEALNEAILLVIVGEFNAGKSSVINALLREPMLPTGVVPTTNEICMIKYGDEMEMTQQEDGTFLKLVPCDMLKAMTIVDTPGTNVVLERQQKLTEDFIPKADLVLFTLSADRPLSESETKFMAFIKQWSKKIVFVLNKKELLTDQEVTEVSSFVQSNASQILGLQEPRIYPVSAKLEEENSADSGFGQLNQVIKDSTGAALGDGWKLKFQTALSLGQSLCNALKEQIRVKNEVLVQETKVVESIAKQMKKFSREMQRDANVQYSNMNRSMDSVFKATEELTDNLLSLNNAKDISGYISGKDTVKASPSAEILSNFEEALRTAVAEHRGWLLENCNQQLSYYSAFLNEKASDLASQKNNLSSSVQSSDGSLGAPVACELGELLKDRLNAEEALLSMSSEVLTEVYETSVKEAATTSFGTAGGAVVVALFLTFLLNSFTEDLVVLAFGAVVAYLSLQSIPLQRAQVNFSIRSKLQDYIKSLTDALKKDLEVAVEETSQRVEAMTVPVEEMISSEKDELERLRNQQEELESNFEDLLVKVSALKG